MKKSLFISNMTSKVYDPQVAGMIGGLVDVYEPPMSRETVAQDPSILADLQVLFTSWNPPVLDEAFLAAAPKLEAVFCAAGSIREFVTEAFWESGAVVCSAWAANAIPVAEFSLAQILLGLKQTHRAATLYRQQIVHSEITPHILGNYKSKVGIISLGMIGRLVAEYLKRFDVQVLAYDPCVSEAEARDAGVILTDLDEIFRSCQVISLHTPWLKETEGLIRGRHLSLMPPGGTFINTARGAIVDEDELAHIFKERSDLSAVMDVTIKEPLPKDSPLWSLPNVILTPHIAGSVGRECYRLGRYMLEELQHYLADEPLKWAITRDKAAVMA